MVVRSLLCSRKDSNTETNIHAALLEVAALNFVEFDKAKLDQENSGPWLIQVRQREEKNAGQPVYASR